MFILFPILWTFESADNFPLITHEIVSMDVCLCVSVCAPFTPPRMAWSSFDAMIATDFYELFYGQSPLRSCINVMLLLPIPFMNTKH